MGEYDEQIVFEMGYNKGFKDGIKGSIPKAEVKKFLEEGTKNISNNVLAIVREDYIHKADYEARLKADLAAMLDEIQLQAEENIENIYEKDEDDLLQLAQHNAFADCFEQYNDLIQEKINALKA